jgi:hypothetical protein
MKCIRWVCAAALVLGGVACGSATDLNPADLVGTWDATKLEFTQVASPGQKVDLVALGGAFSITFNADSSYRAILTAPEASPDTITGTWDGSVDVLTLRETGSTGEQQFDYTLSGSTITLSGADTSFDFGNGDEPAKVGGTLVKR